jgi:hypothetical protein
MAMAKKREWLWLFGVTLCISVVCAWYAKGRRERLPGQGVVEEFVRDSKYLIVFGGPTAKPSDLAAVEQFGDFYPGLSPEDAARLYGEPDRVISQQSAQYFEYHNRYGRIRIGSEVSEDGVSNFLVFFPYDGRPGAFFPRAVVDQMRREMDEENINLIECGFQQPFMAATIKDGDLVSIFWLDSRELQKRPNPLQCIDE